MRAYLIFQEYRLYYASPTKIMEYLGFADRSGSLLRSNNWFHRQTSRFRKKLQGKTRAPLMKEWGHGLHFENFIQKFGGQGWERMCNSSSIKMRITQPCPPNISVHFSKMEAVSSLFYYRSTIVVRWCCLWQILIWTSTPIYGLLWGSKKTFDDLKFGSMKFWYRFPTFFPPGFGFS